MSTHRTIAAISEYLRLQVQEALKADENVTGQTAVTVGPPDKARGGRTDPQVNLFLYQVLPDANWRNRDLPNAVKPGERAAPLLALRLGYLLTAFGAPDETTGSDQDDVSAHRFLGSAMRRLHDRPEFPRDVENYLQPVPQPPPPPLVEPPRATLQPLSPDEMSKVWSGLQSPYRVSVAYEVGPVLIRSTRSTQSAPPVLSRGESPRPDGTSEPNDPGFSATPGSAPAEITAVRFPQSQAGVRLGDVLIIEGQGLDRVNVLDLRHAALPVALAVAPAFDSATRALRWRVPEALEEWPAGLWTVTAGRHPPGDSPERREFTSAPVPFALLPELVLSEVGGVPQPPQLMVEREGNPQVVVAVSLPLRLRPPLRLDGARVRQRISLYVGERELPLAVRVVVAGPEGQQIEFFEEEPEAAAKLYEALRAMPVERRHVRVRVDGADSSLLRLPFDAATSRREYDVNLRLGVPLP